MLMIGLGNTEEYYPTVVMSALMTILKDSSLNTHHTAVIQAIMSMYKALGLKCVSFLPEVENQLTYADGRLFLRIFR